ncbi:DUF3164 family protein [Comamonas thiooxydans]|uniref:DUF3164 family protein n=1 Tax=Comamonas thiooxydans TaxID=363952 RepID=UPI001CC9AFD2|nr:DUF3164 family protein [Comamonas thiooxydans]UBQ43984.1 DUF3164 family protein [Comamonas thiooxydans]
MTQQSIPETIPEGYMKNALGHLVPRANVREQDLLRDEIAKKVASRAIRLHQELTEFKKDTLGEVADLVKIAGERYDVALGGKKGNVSISSYDGKYKVQRSVADRIQFTEEIEAAKALINQCIARWSEGANDKIRAIVDRAFNKDTKGQIKTAAVLDLMRLDIDDVEWKRAMDAIRDSIQSTGTATYVRVYERIGDSDQYKAIPLDLAAV